MPSATPSVLLAGCGDLAIRLAALLPHWQCTGLRRQPSCLPATIRPLAADLCDAPATTRALAGHTFDYVVITLTPGERTEARYRAVYVDGTAHLLSALAGQPRVLFVSSTSVYAQDAGEWVDEESPATGSGFSGRCLREAEAQVRSAGLPATCVRLSGIYGPGRERLLRMVRDGRLPLADAAQWTNRIHVDDGAAVLAFILQRWQQGEAPASCYVASDPNPVQAGEVWQWLARRLGVQPPLVGDAWRQQPAAGKRCDSRRLQQEGFRFAYPDFRAGYDAVLAGQ